MLTERGCSAGAAPAELITSTRSYTCTRQVLVATSFTFACGPVDNSLWMLLLLLLHALVDISCACITATHQARQGRWREGLALRLSAGRHHDASRGLR